MTPKVSIIVPVYNAQPYLKKCLDSLRLQTLQDIEIIVINDGSTDGSQAIIDEHMMKDSRMKCVVQPNAGQSAARNTGLAIASGEHIGFVDSDDWVEPNMYQVLYHLAKDNEADLAVCGRRDVSEHGSVVTSGDLKDECFSIKKLGLGNFLLHKRGELGAIVWNKIFRRSVIESNRLRFLPNKDVFYEDILFNLCFQVHSDNVACTTTVLYNYFYRRPGSIMTTARPGIEPRIINAAIYFNDYLQKHEKAVECSAMVSRFMLEMVSEAFLHSYKTNRNKYFALKKAYTDIAGNRIYRELLMDVLKEKFSASAKMRASLFLLKPYWFAAFLLNLSIHMSRTTKRAKTQAIKVQ